MRAPGRPLAGILLGLLIAAGTMLPAAFASPVVAAPGGSARFLDTSAEADFPLAIDFTLDVEADDPIDAVELYWRASEDPQLSAAYPELAPATRVTLTWEVDMTIDYLPPGLDIVYFWRVTETDGDISESPQQAVWYMDESQDWETRTDGLVTLYWYDGGDDFADDIVDTANRTLDRLASELGVTADEPIRIIAYGDEGDFEAALPPNSAEWIGGQAYPGLNVIFAIVEPGRGAEEEIRRMVPHEVSHLVLDQATENPFNSPPNWLDEGLAVYAQETEDPRMQPILDDAVEEGQLIPVRALNASFPLDDEQALLSYAASWSIVTFIVEELGEAEMRELVAVFREEVSYEEAVERALGMSLDELDARWKAWLGYAGDAARPTAAPGNNADDADSGDGDVVDVDPADDSEPTSTEWAVAAVVFGIGALAGLALLIWSIRGYRRAT